MDTQQMSKIALNVRRNIVKSVSAAKSGHPGGSLSMVEILVSLYFGKMNIDPKNPKMENRDRFVLSKGHGAPGLYSVLAEKGFFPEAELTNLRKFGSMLQGHPDCKKVPGVDMSTGSLGQGFSIACGMANAIKYKKSNEKVYTILGDGELQEGLIWEAAMTAAHYKLSNLTAIVDWNGLQIDGANDEVMSLGNIADKFKSFGFYVIEVDGHSFDQLLAAYDVETGDKPKCIIAKTQKGRGVSFMLDNAGWHGKAPNTEETEKALAELEG